MSPARPSRRCSRSGTSILQLPTQDAGYGYADMLVFYLCCCSYLNQAACKSEKKAAGVSFFFKKLRF